MNNVMKVLDPCVKLVNEYVTRVDTPPKGHCKPTTPIHLRDVLIITLFKSITMFWRADNKC